ncbi:MAG: sugar phosphate isomerase/epimerase [Clostridia bacterium]|nr:sugar phosphate isomerase/epimerase [Clostridia bacterium]
MKIGINMNAYEGLELEREIELISKNGFDSIFIGMDYSNVVRIMKLIGERNINCESIHAPFDGINDMWREGSNGDTMLSRLTDAVDACAANSIPVCVVHLSSGVDAPRISNIGYERFSHLVEHARACGVKLAFENQRMLANLAFVMEQFPDVGFCWDTGHEECFAHSRRFMPLFGDRLVQLHVHDNFCEYNGDAHMLPYDGKIDFDRVAKSIGKARYNNSIMLEVFNWNKAVYENTTAEDFYRRASQRARMVAEKVDYYRKFTNFDI